MPNEVAKTSKNDIRSVISGMEAQFQMVVPQCLTSKRMVRVALSAIGRVPKLKDCTRESLLGALMTCAELGIEPDGRRAHLIPYGKDCKLIIDYKGLVELVRRSGQVQDVRAEIVCANDEFEWNNGQVTHRIDFKQARGEAYAAYSFVLFKDGSESFEVMTKDEIEAIRKRSMAGKSGPWVTDWNEMAKKTVFRRHSKWLPLSAEFRDALEKDVDSPADISASMPDVTVFADPMAAMKPADEVKEEAPAIEPEEKKEAPPTKTPPPKKEASGLTAVEDLDKRQCLASIKLHAKEGYYDGVLDLVLEPGAQPEGYPVSVLHDVLTALRDEAGIQ